MSDLCFDCHERKAAGRGLCSRCYARRRKAGTLNEAGRALQVCRWPECSEFPGLNSRGASKGFCDLHYRWNVSRARWGVSYAEYEAQHGQATRRLMPNGYAQILRDGKWIAEHRVQMELKLGRPLVRGESVHHINGIRDDNRPENLELWLGAIRYGQRAADIVCPHCHQSYAVAAESDEQGPTGTRTPQEPQTGVQGCVAVTDDSALWFKTIDRTTYDAMMIAVRLAYEQFSIHEYVDMGAARTLGQAVQLGEAWSQLLRSER